jgi:hypothetical protein
VKAGIFVLDADAAKLKKLASQPSSKFEGTIVKDIPGDGKGKNKRYFLEGLKHEWIENVFIPRVRNVLGNLIPAHCKYCNYTLIYEGNSLQEPHIDGEKDAVSFLCSIREFENELYLALYDKDSYNESDRTISWSKVNIPPYHAMAFKSHLLWHGGGIHEDIDRIFNGNPRLFMIFTEFMNDTSFKLLDTNLKKMIKIEMKIHD